jgi:signal transduction histidine kinase
MNGFNSFDPQEVLDNTRKVSVLLSEVKYFSKDGKTPLVQNFGFGDLPKIRIPSNNRNCSFTMALSDFSNSNANTFSYKLEPINSFFQTESSEWKSNGRKREIRFEYLPAGKYYLRISGTTAKGVSATEFAIELDVKEFFYKTWWFASLFIIGILGLAYSLHRYRLSQALKIERLRTRLSSDLHDDVGSLLSGVAYQMELLEYSADDKNKPLVRKIAESSRRAMSRMRDVVWAIDTRNSTFLDLTERMREFAEDQLEPLQIAYRFELEALPQKKELSSEIRHASLLIFKEFLTNTVKHAQASRVDIKLLRRGRNFEMIIQDDGRGMDEHKKTSTGQGLANMKMRAQKIKASLDFLEGPGFGICVCLPMF